MEVYNVMTKLKGKKYFKEKVENIKRKPVNELTFGERIILLRTEQGLSQAKLADRINPAISLSAMNNYENDSRKPDIDILLGIANALEVSTDFLLGKTDFMTPETGIRAICENTGLSEESVKYLQENHSYPVMDFINGLIENESTGNGILRSIDLMILISNDLLSIEISENEDSLKFEGDDYEACEFSSVLSFLELQIFKAQVEFFDYIKGILCFSELEKKNEIIDNIISSRILSSTISE